MRCSQQVVDSICIEIGAQEAGQAPLVRLMLFPHEDRGYVFRVISLLLQDGAQLLISEENLLTSSLVIKRPFLLQVQWAVFSVGHDVSSGVMIRNRILHRVGEGVMSDIV